MDRVLILPPLREDLRLIPGATQADGAPSWTIHDPVSNRFFQIGWLEFEFLSRWRLRRAPLVLRGVATETPLAADEQSLAEFVDFLQQHQLVRASEAVAVDRLKKIERKARGSWFKWLLHNYLFFRLPLVHPQAFLARTLPWVRWLFSDGFRHLSVFAALLGLVLVGRQWDVFVHTLADTFSVEGLMGWALALAFAKTLHELGHAFMATQLGVRVAHMGVAFLVMWPMLYTDTGESWKLTDRTARFRIAAAGMMAEFALAAWATLAWALWADGATRDALFFLATTSWVITVGINASPFMRFDGYFLMSDALDLPNLHSRSTALAQRSLRRMVLGLEEPDPDPTLSPRAKSGLILFAYVTWLYRLGVFIAIALAVYHVFFKALGVFLFAVEIVWFVLRPIYNEGKVWMKRRTESKHSAVIRLVAVMALIALWLLVPWRNQISAVAWMHAERHQFVYAPLPARLESIRPQGEVKRGEVLAVLEAPDIRSRAVQSALLSQALERQLAQSVGRVDGLERQAVFAEQLAQEQAELAAATAELKRLSLTAAFDGRLVDLDPSLGPGVWVNGQQPLASLVDPTAWVVDALVAQEDLNRLKVGSRAAFFSHATPTDSLEGEVISIDSSRVQQLPHPMLAASHGGPVPILREGQSKEATLVPRDALYRVRIRLDQAPTSSAMIWGRATLSGERKALIVDAAVRAASVFIRESGF